jgi:hypothetical protein
MGKAAGGQSENPPRWVALPGEKGSVLSTVANDCSLYLADFLGTLWTLWALFLARRLKGKTALRVLFLLSLSAYGKQALAGATGWC